MDSDYNLFECLPDGSVMWRGSVKGLESARLKLQELAEGTDNDHFAIRLPAREVVFRADADRSAAELAKRVFQIAYTEHLRQQRADLLRGHGYGVVSVIGNEAAKTLLTALRLRGDDIALFMVGHGAPESVRNEMVAWLRSRYPSVRIIALNPPNQQIQAADFNVLQNGPELWLRLLVSTAGGS
jgi:surfactin synthase thioesterase subunit